MPLLYKYTFSYFVAMLLFVSTFRFPGVVVQGERNTVKQKGTLAQTELSRYIFICHRNKKQKQSSLLFNFNITEICKETNKKLVHLGRTNFYLKVVQNTHGNTNKFSIYLPAAYLITYRPTFQGRSQMI